MAECNVNVNVNVTSCGCLRALPLSCVTERGIEECAPVPRDGPTRRPGVPPLAPGPGPRRPEPSGQTRDQTPPEGRPPPPDLNKIII